MKKFYKPGFFILLSIFIGICLIGQAGRWPWLQATGIAFQYGQQKIQSISAGTLRVSSTASSVLDVDSLSVDYITSNVNTDRIYLGGGDTLTKSGSAGSHAYIIFNTADTFWLAADTTGF